MILALDTATCTGWAVGAAGSTPIFGTADFSGGHTGQVVLNFQSFLAELVMIHRPAWIVFESPYVPRPSRKRRGAPLNVKTLRRLFTLVSLVEAAACQAGARCFEARPEEISRFFLGNDRPLVRDEKKRATIEMCCQYGWLPTNDNEADALALWAMAEAKFAPRLASARGDGPLFTQKKGAPRLPYGAPRLVTDDFASDNDSPSFSISGR